MASYRGTVRLNALEGGFWELRTDDGQSLQLRGGDDGLRKENLSVVVEGTIDKGAVGIGMTGPVLNVASYKIGQ